MIKRLMGSWLVILLFMLVLALGVAAAGKLGAQPVQAASSPAIYQCTPDSIVSANVRVVAHCAAPYTNVPLGVTIYWFAYPTSDSANASRMLSLLETAHATGTAVTFYFDALDTSGAAYGCLASDCRAFWAITNP